MRKEHWRERNLEMKKKGESIVIIKGVKMKNMKN